MAEGDPKIGKKDDYRGDVITLSTADESTPTLYHYDGSYYSQVQDITIVFNIVFCTRSSVASFTCGGACRSMHIKIKWVWRLEASEWW